MNMQNPCAVGTSTVTPAFACWHSASTAAAGRSHGGASLPGGAGRLKMVALLESGVAVAIVASLYAAR